MKQLSGLDTMFLNLETNAVPMHIGGLAILDPGTALSGVYWLLRERDDQLVGRPGQFRADRKGLISDRREEPP